MSGYQIRLALDSDSTALSEIIRRIFADYANCVVDIEREEPDLLAIRSAFDRKGGKIWVAENAGRVVGCGGLVRAAMEHQAEVKKLYVAQEHRRAGLGRLLCEHVIAEARLWEVARLVAWSDSRFVEAHQFYPRLGFVRQPGSRELFDLSKTVEVPFELEL